MVKHLCLVNWWRDCWYIGRWVWEMFNAGIQKMSVSWSNGWPNLQTVQSAGEVHCDPMVLTLKQASVSPAGLVQARLLGPDPAPTSLQAWDGTGGFYLHEAPRWCPCCWSEAYRVNTGVLGDWQDCPYFTSVETEAEVAQDSLESP